MNDRFFLLDDKRQEQILNAGYKGFAQNTYAKTSMSMVAEEAGISKSLLFHYFLNKKEFYLYLYERAVMQIKETLPDEAGAGEEDLLELLTEHIGKKWKLLKENPFMLQFMNRAYYEKEEELQKDLREITNQYMTKPIEEIIYRIQSKGRAQTDSELVKVLFYLSEGFALMNKEKIQENPEDAIEEFISMIRLLRVKNIL